MMPCGRNLIYNFCSVPPKASSAVDPEDVEMLEDLLVAAVNEGMRKIDEMTEAEMGKLTGGMKMPGMF